MAENLNLQMGRSTAVSAFMVHLIVNLLIWMFPELINYTQPVYVWRDDPNSRQNTIKEIIERATSKEDWPQVTSTVQFNLLSNLHLGVD